MPKRLEHRDGKKRCCGCRRWKPLRLFNRDKHYWDGFSKRCKSCNKSHCREQYQRHLKSHREARRRRLYGLRPEEYSSRLATQGGVCAICGEPPVADGPRPGLSVDHDHQTGENRGLLCSRCNAGIGNLRDDPRLLRAAAAYLESWGHLS